MKTHYEFHEIKYMFSHKRLANQWIQINTKKPEMQMMTI
jgi:hypothetical protein